MRLMARFRRVAITWGALLVRSWWRSSSKVTSRTQWTRFSIPNGLGSRRQWSRAGPARWGWSRTRADDLGGAPGLLAAVGPALGSGAGAAHQGGPGGPPGGPGGGGGNLTPARPAPGFVGGAPPPPMRGVHPGDGGDLGPGAGP